MSFFASINNDDINKNVSTTYIEENTITTNTNSATQNTINYKVIVGKSSQSTFEISQVTGQPTFDTYMRLYRKKLASDPIGNNNIRTFDTVDYIEIEVDDDSGSDSYSKITYNLMQNTEYILSVGGYRDKIGKYILLSHANIHVNKETINTGDIHMNIYMGIMYQTMSLSIGNNNINNNLTTYIGFPIISRTGFNYYYNTRHYLGNNNDIGTFSSNNNFGPTYGSYMAKSGEIVAASINYSYGPGLTSETIGTYNIYVSVYGGDNTTTTASKNKILEIKPNSSNIIQNNYGASASTENNSPAYGTWNTMSFKKGDYIGIWIEKEGLTTTGLDSNTNSISWIVEGNIFVMLDGI